MNSLYTLGVRQTNSIQADLERLRNGDTSAALLGLHLSNPENYCLIHNVSYDTLVFKLFV